MLDHNLIAQLDFFASRSVLSSERLLGGLNHQVHKIVTEDAVVVARQAQQNTIASNEIALQQCLSLLGVTPKVIESRPGITLLEFIAGIHPQVDFWQRDKLAQFARLVAKVHCYEVDIPLTQLNLSQHIEHYARQVSLSSQQQHWVAFVLQHLAADSKHSPTLGLCHNDLNPLNIIVNGEHICLLDWESGAYGEVFFDLAGFTVEHHLSPSACDYFLAQYLKHQNFMLNATSSKLKLQLMKTAYVLVCWLWYLQREQQTGQSFGKTLWYEKLLLKCVA